jgi:hypothetical protein
VSSHAFSTGILRESGSRSSPASAAAAATSTAVENFPGQFSHNSTKKSGIGVTYSKNEAPVSLSGLSAKGDKLLKHVASFNRRYSRGGAAGEGYLTLPQILSELKAREKTAEKFYSPDAADKLLNASEAVQNRMRIKISEEYLLHCLRTPANAQKPHPVHAKIISMSQFNFKLFIRSRLSIFAKHLSKSPQICSKFWHQNRVD